MDLRWEILAGYGPLFASGLLMTLQLALVAIVVGVGVAFYSGARIRAGGQAAEGIAAAAHRALTRKA